MLTIAHGVEGDIFARRFDLINKFAFVLIIMKVAARVGRAVRFVGHRLPMRKQLFHVLGQFRQVFLAGCVTAGEIKVVVKSIVDHWSDSSFSVGVTFQHCLGKGMGEGVALVIELV